MAKRGIIGTVGVAIVGGIVVLAIGEAANPGSAHKTNVAITTSAMEAENGVGSFVSNGLANVGPVLANGRQALQQSGIGNMFGGAPQTGADDPTAVPPAGATNDQR